MVATTNADPLVQTTDIHVLDVTRGKGARLTSDPALDSKPRWSPNGTHIVFDSSRDRLPPNLFRMSAIGIGREERLLKSPLVQHVNDWSLDGRFVVFAMLDPTTQWDLWLLPMKMDSPAMSGTPARLLQSPFNEYNGQLSPDGKWLAYQSDESGDWDVYLREVGATRPTGRYRRAVGFGRCGAGMDGSCFISPMRR